MGVLTLICVPIPHELFTSTRIPVQAIIKRRSRVQYGAGSALTSCCALNSLCARSKMRGSTRVNGHHALSSCWLSTFTFESWLSDWDFLGLEAVVIEAVSVSDWYAILCFGLVDFSWCFAQRAFHFQSLPQSSNRGIGSCPLARMASAQFIALPLCRQCSSHSFAHASRSASTSLCATTSTPSLSTRSS